MDIRIEGLEKSYNGTPVLRHFHAVLPAGQTTVLMGSSGSGKTTLGKLILGLEVPDAGTITGMNGQRTAAVFQEDRLCEQLSAIGNVLLVLKHRLPLSDLLAAFAAVDLFEEELRKPVRQLSGGQRRRVAILRAVLADSDFLCMDEPFLGMDRDTKEKTMAFVKNAIAGKTVLFITHDSTEATRFGGRHVMID